MSEFSDRPFVAGTLTGIRSFRPLDGHLLAPTLALYTWREGVNVAECRDPFAGLSRQFAQLAQSMKLAAYQMTKSINQSLGRPSPPPPEDSPEPTPPAEHTAGALSCRCGFYAYFDRRHNPYHKPGNVLGLIEGWGTATVGTRGFRCEKARIVALVVERGRLIDTGTNYPDVPVFLTVDDALTQHPLTPQPAPPALERRGSHAAAVILDEPHTLDPLQRAIAQRRTRNTGPEDPYRLTRRRSWNQP